LSVIRLRPPLRSTLFPYTTLFRSKVKRGLSRIFCISCFSFSDTWISSGTFRSSCRQPSQQTAAASRQRHNSRNRRYFFFLSIPPHPFLAVFRCFSSVSRRLNAGIKRKRENNLSRITLSYYATDHFISVLQFYVPVPILSFHARSESLRP